MTNPYLPPAPPAPVVEHLDVDPILGASLHMEGLVDARSARNVTPPAEAAPSPVITADTVWFVGASGGVGVTTLAELGGEHVIDGGTFPPPWQAPAYIVAATHPAGLAAAGELARARAHGLVTLDVRGLLLVHDRPKLSKPTIQLARSVAGLYPRTMTIPFVPAWREPGDGERDVPVRIRRVLATLTPTRSKK